MTLLGAREVAAAEDMRVLAALLNVTRAKSGGKGFPGGSMVKNPPGNAGDTGSIPAPGDSTQSRNR